MLYGRHISQHKKLKWCYGTTKNISFITDKRNYFELFQSSSGQNLQFVRTKCNVLEQNNRFQFVDKHEQNNKNCSVTPELMPFEAIPSADDGNFRRFLHLKSFTSQITSLITEQWQNRFHEHIDEHHMQFGPIFRKSLGSVDAIFVKSPYLIRDVFAYEGKYPKHPLPEAWTFYNQLHKCKRGLFFMDDVEWLKTRRQLAPLMLRNDKRFNAAIEIASEHLVNHWRTNAAVNHQDIVEIPQVLTSLYGWSIRVLIGIIFGRAANQMFEDLRETIDQFAHIVQNVFEDTVPFQTISPQLARMLGLSIWSKFDANVTKTLKIASQMVEYGWHQNQCDGLLNEMQKLGMPKEMIQRIFIDLIIAAGDTTAVSTQWALYLLSQNISIQNDIRNELKIIDRYDTPLIKGTVREALRLFPVATFIGRILDEEAVLNNYRIHKHSLVLISMYSAGRDEKSFPNPNAFQPWRWSRDPSFGTLNAVQYAQSSIPYALGSRNCIGQRIANAQMYIILAKLLSSFEISLLNTNDIDIVMRLIIMPSKKLRLAIKQI